MSPLLFALALFFTACSPSTEAEQIKPVSSDPSPKAAITTPESWDVNVKSIRYDAESHQLFVQAALAYVPAVGGASRTEPVHVGVTVVSSKGVETDLMVQTLFAGNFDAPILFSTELPGDVSQVLIGVWNTRVEPCEVDRHGCREFGFVLDNSLASWPDGLYNEGIRQRIPPSPYALSVKGSPEKCAAVERSLGSLLSTFGVTPKVSCDPSSAPSSAGIYITDMTDRALARDLAARLPGIKRSDVHVQKTSPNGQMIVVLP